MQKAFTPPARGFWVFAYGSLLWSPGFAFAERRPARLNGYHRALCVYSWMYRGAPEKPGLVFALERGGHTQGVAFRVRAQDARTTYRYIYEREMPTAVYRPVWADCVIDTPRPKRAKALTFVADRRHEQYTGRLSDDEIAHLIRQGEGRAGTCKDYVINTARHLRSLGIRDRWLEKMVAKLD